MIKLLAGCCCAPLAFELHTLWLSRGSMFFHVRPKSYLCAQGMVTIFRARVSARLRIEQLQARSWPTILRPQSDNRLVLRINLSRGLIKKPVARNRRTTQCGQLADMRWFRNVFVKLQHVSNTEQPSIVVVKKDPTQHVLPS